MTETTTADEPNVDPSADPNPDEPIEGADDLPENVKDGDLAAHEPEE